MNQRRGQVHEQGSTRISQRSRDQMEKSASLTSQQNGRAKRLKRKIMEMLRYLMINANFGHKYWQYATTTATFIHNQTSTTSNQGMASPFKAMWGQKPKLYNLPLFACKSQVHIPNVLCGTLDAKTKDYIFLEYTLKELMHGFLNMWHHVSNSFCETP